MTDKSPLDLPARVPLDALRDLTSAEARRAHIGAIAREAAAAREQLLRSPRQPSDLLSALGGWSRPALAAAAVLLIVGAVTLFMSPVPAQAAPATLAESVGIPAQMMEWSTSGTGPQAAALLMDMNASRSVR